MPDSAEVSAYNARQAELVVLALRAAQKAWSRLPKNNLGAWPELARPLASALAAAQYRSAAEGAKYVASVAPRATVLAEVVPAGFAGIASDGRSLTTLLDQPRITTLTRIRDGIATTDAIEAGLRQLEAITVTQVQDAGRGGSSVAMATRPAIVGYVRHLNQPSCSRCAVLAGRFYRWNAGFLRHPKCDCFHVPQIGERRIDLDDPGTSGERYFETLDAAEQDRVFTKAGAEAIRSGADLAQVVNARRGMYTTARGQLMTREGARRRGGRLMPEQIYVEAGGDREEAVRLLKLHGYAR